MVRPGSATARLAQDIADRRAAGEVLPLLFLGAACSRAAQTPRIADIGRDVITQLSEDPDIAPPGLPPADAPDSVIVPAFRELVLELPPIQRRALALHAANDVPVPQFVQDIALLVRDRLFSTVMTSAFDALLERALNFLSVRPGQSLGIVDVGDDPASPITAPGALVLLKVLGSRVPGTLESPVIVVGHEADDPEIFEALSVRGGPVWWVSESPPPEGLVAVSGGREIVLVDGPGGHPDRFFGELAVLAVQMPAVNVLADPKGAYRKATALHVDDKVSSISAALAAVGGTAPPDDEQEFERQLLEGRHRRCEEVLGRLQQQGAGGALGSSLEQQVTYQRQELTRLEQQLRSLSANRSDLLDALALVEESPEAAASRPAAHYLLECAGRIRAEYERDEPDEDVISAALAALAVLGSRLGVSSELMHRLEAHAPSPQAVAS